MKKSALFVLSVCSIFILAFPSGAHASAVTRPPNNLGLSAYWSFDEGTGTKTVDHSGNGNSGTLSGTTIPAWVSGRHAKALSFDGSSSYVTGTGAGLSNLGASANVTISAWIKPTSISGTAEIFNKGASGSCFNYGMVLASGVLSARNSSADRSVESGTVPINTWTLVTVVFNGSGATGYINGVLSSTNGSAVTTSCANTPWTIGTRASNALSEFFPGSIDDVRIYSRALTAAQVAALYTQGEVVQKEAPLSGLVGQWLFNEGTSTIARDTSGNGFNGTLSTTGSTVPVWISGKHGQALSFDGSTSYVSSASGPNFAAGAPFSVGGWVYLKSGAGSFPMIMDNKIGSLAMLFGANIGSLNKVGFNLYLGTLQTTNTVVPTKNVWHHVIGTYDGSVAKIYVDGVLMSTSSSGTSAGYTGGVLMGNGTAGGNSFWNGYMDDMRMYNRALTQAEVTQLYNAHQTAINTSSTNLQRGTSLANGLVGLWTFDGADIGTSILDRSGNGFNGYLVAPTSATSSRKVIGKMGQGFSFAGQGTGGIDLGNSTSLTPSNFTIAGWVNISSSTYNYNYILSSDRDCCSVYNGIGLSVVGGQLSGNIWNSTQYNITSTGLIPVSKWTHVAFTYNGTTKSLYINGVLDKSSAQTVNPGTPASFDTYIGSMGLNSGAFYTLGGKLDDLRLYNRALSASEVNQLYLMGK